MTSAALVRAARTNGAKSRGPKTPEGKRKSSANSRKHGLSGRYIVFDPECAEDFRTLHATYTSEYSPQGDLEQRVVQTLALAEARLTWVCRQETHHLNREYDALPSETEPQFRQALAARNATVACDLLGRLESRFFRQADQARDRLFRIRRQRSAKNRRTNRISAPKGKNRRPQNRGFGQAAKSGAAPRNAPANGGNKHLLRPHPRAFRQ